MNNIQQHTKSDIRQTAWNGLSENTKQAYQNDLTLFARQYDFEKANPDTILKYINNLRKSGAKNATINRKVSSLSKFYKVQIAAGIRENNPVEQLKSVSKIYFKTQKDINVPLTSEDFKQLPEGKIRLIVTTLVNTGLRISEFINIKNKDISVYNKDYYRIRILGKRQKERDIYISKKLYDKIKQEYPDNTKIDNLFYTRNFTPYGRKALWKQIKGLFKKYTGKDIHPHSLRHYFIDVKVNKEKKNIKAVQYAAGHASVKTTLDYTYGNLKPEEFELQGE